MSVRGRTVLCLSAALAVTALSAVPALSQATGTSTSSLKATAPQPPSKDELALFDACRCIPESGSKEVGEITNTNFNVNDSACPHNANKDISN